MPLSDFHPKKRKGQTFLIDKNIVAKILTAVCVSGKDVVLEVGSGKGTLTNELAVRAKRVVAVELDKKLYNYLKTILGDCDNTELIRNDILRFDLAKYIQKNKIKQKIVLIGNIPYSITTPILEYIFENIRFLSAAYLMVQKEFALRLVAGPNSKDYSSLSCFAQFFVDPKILFSVKQTCFSPRPKVDSCFVKLEPKNPDYWKNEIELKDKELLFKVIQTAFNQRRKKILNSLSVVLDKDKLSKILLELGIDVHKRAENLSIHDFIKISNLCFEYLDSRHIIV